MFRTIGIWSLTLLVCMSFIGAFDGPAFGGEEEADMSGWEKEAKEFLKTLVYTEEDVDNWISNTAFPFCKYDGVVGYLHISRIFQEGYDKSWVTYSYSPQDERTMFLYPNKNCRINTYGNSFTSCEQVNDGESWQEVLAAHLCEPVRNYGIGGFSVYQSYRRMIKEENFTPAKYIVLNIFDDDHYRNLISWQRIRFGTHPKSFHPTLPYVEVNPATGKFVEHDNVCPTEKSLDNMTDLDWIYENFKDDFLLKICLAQHIARQGYSGGELRDRHLQTALVEGSDLKSEKKGNELIYGVIEQLATEHGLKDVKLQTPQDLVNVTNELYLNAALFASMRVVEKALEYAKANDKEILFVLSFPHTSTEKMLKTGKRMDQPFVDFLDKNGINYVDTLQAHVEDFANFKITPEEYSKRYYVGHYGPAGNFFQAFAMKDQLVEMMDPKPLPYREDHKEGFFDPSAEY